MGRRKWVERKGNGREGKICFVGWCLSVCPRTIGQADKRTCTFVNLSVQMEFDTGSNSTWLDSTRLDTFDVSSPCILAVSS